MGKLCVTDTQRRSISYKFCDNRYEKYVLSHFRKIANEKKMFVGQKLTHITFSHITFMFIDGA
jgi:hypothetical protein